MRYQRSCQRPLERLRDVFLRHLANRLPPDTHLRHPLGLPAQPYDADGRDRPTSCCPCTTRHEGHVTERDDLAGSDPDRASMSAISLAKNHWLDFSPRLGVAWDPTGKGKWAIRMGGGIFFNREAVSDAMNLGNNPPFSKQIIWNGGGRPLDSSTDRQHVLRRHRNCSERQGNQRADSGQLPVEPDDRT